LWNYRLDAQKPPIFMCRSIAIQIWYRAACSQIQSKLYNGIMKILANLQNRKGATNFFLCETISNRALTRSEMPAMVQLSQWHEWSKQPIIACHPCLCDTAWVFPSNFTESEWICVWLGYHDIIWNHCAQFLWLRLILVQLYTILRVSYSGGIYPRHEFDMGGISPINLSFLDIFFLVLKFFNLANQF
jgi:hypothetical protein